MYVPTCPVSSPRPAPGSGPTSKYQSAAQIARNLSPGLHYEVSLKDQKVDLTQAGYKFTEQIVGTDRYPNPDLTPLWYLYLSVCVSVCAGKQLFDLSDPWAYFVIQALKAKELFQRDQQYIVGEAGQVSIVDSFTGRVLSDRRFSDGLQQAIEAKVRLGWG